MFAHGLMFHHFHDDQHPKGQGAIDRTRFERILDAYGERILSANEWLARSKDGTLASDSVCLTFDDALKCQIDVALPVLSERGLTAFWFVYSSVFEGNVEPLEIFRYFRTVAFKDFDHFCDAFMDAARAGFGSSLSNGLEGVELERYLSEFPFYSRNDRLYRFVRDRILTTEEYDAVLRSMMETAGFDQIAAKSNLWMTDTDLRNLTTNEHVVGLHSYTHPIRIEALEPETQRHEYDRNYQHIARVAGVRPRAMSHPCNSYNSDTIAILDSLGIQIGFCSNMSRGPAKSRLEIPREDHANIMAALQ